MDDYLEGQANIIESVLRGHGFDVQVAGGDLSPRLVHYHLRVPSGVRLARLAPMLGELATGLQVSAVRLAADQESGLPTLEVPRPDPSPVRLLPLAKRVADEVPPCTATLGLDISGTPLLLRLDAREVGSVLVAGDAGAGKSSLLQTMALSLALHNSPDTLRMLLLDLTRPARLGRRQRSAWQHMEHLPHLVAEPIREPSEAGLRVRWLGRLLHERRARLEQGREIDGPALIILFDGLEAVLEDQGASERRQILAEIVERGRELRMHLVGATRHPQALAGIGWGTRLVGRCAGGELARAASGINGSGAEGLLGEGDFVAVLGGETVRLQAAYAADEEVQRISGLLQRVAEAERRVRDLEHASPEAQLKHGLRPAQPAPRTG